jgi:ankyrin repeat protein
MTPLMLAAGKGAADIVEVLLNFKADVHLEDKFGNTALHYACEDGNFRTTHLILTAGADPFMPNFNEETAFDIADANRHSHISYLLETSNLNSNSYSNSDGPTQKDPIQEQMDTQLNETLAKHSHEIARIILKNRIKYAKFLLLGKIIEDMPVEVFEDPLLDDEDFV